MKKLKYLVLTLLLVFVTGCGAKPEDILKEASENMKKLDNYHMNLDMNMKMSYEGTSMEMGAKASSDIDVKNGAGAMETTVSFFGMSETEKSYFTVKDGKTTTYTQDDEEWYKETEEDVSNNVDFDIFSNANSIEKVEGEKNTYKVVLSKEQVKELVGSTGEDMEDMEFENIDIKITVEDKHITKMVMSMSAEGNEVTFTFEFSKFNEVSVTIPEEVINEAVDYEDYEYDFEDYE